MILVGPIRTAHLAKIRHETETIVIGTGTGMIVIGIPVHGKTKRGEWMTDVGKIAPMALDADGTNGTETETEI